MLINELEDAPRVLKENFQRLEDWLSTEPITNAGWRVVTATFISNGTFSIPHGLGFTPTDIIQTSTKGTGSAVVDYEAVDGTNIVITTSGTSSSDPLTIRLLVGRIG